MPLEPEDQNHLQTAKGYCELGMFLDADAELERIDAEVSHIPTAGDCPWQINVLCR